MANGCSIERPATSSSEELRHELANLNHDGNARPHHHRVRRNWLSRPPHRSASALSRIFPFGSRQGIRIGGTDCLVLMIRNLNPKAPIFTTSGQSRMRLPAPTAL